MNRTWAPTMSLPHITTGTTAAETASTTHPQITTETYIKIRSMSKTQFSDTYSNHCKRLYCQVYLSEKERQGLSVCSRKASRVFDNHPEMRGSGCVFMRGEGRPPVALVSHPGSGNTWVRGLLEQATGICTGYYLLVYIAI